MQDQEDPHEAASEAEVRSELNQLTSQDLRRLYSFAGGLVYSYRDFADGRSAQDLYQEAIERTLEPAGRNWYKNRVSFVVHLMGAMRSIASHWAEHYHNNPKEVPILSTDLKKPEDADDTSTPMENVPSGSPGIARIIDSRRALDRVFQLFEEDEEAFNVLVCLAEQKTGPETRRLLGLSQKRYHAVVERIRYQIVKAFAKGI
jgi:DNA-directed RNA polymerase specialized sigma24 family protein